MVRLEEEVHKSPAACSLYVAAGFPQDVLHSTSQDPISVGNPAAAMDSGVLPARSVLDEQVEMVSSRVPRYWQQVLTWLAATTAAQPYVSIPSSTPSNASGVVDPDFAGFAFEQASLWNYAQDADGSANEFSINLIAAITNRTGGKPLIRLGGTS